MNQVSVVSVGDTPSHLIAGILERPGQLRIVRRCSELAGLLAACQSGLAQAAVIAKPSPDLTATLVDRLAAVGVCIVAVVATPEEGRRLHGIGVATVAEQATADVLARAVLDAIEGRRHHGATGFAVAAVADALPFKSDAGPLPSSPGSGTADSDPAGSSTAAHKDAGGSGGKRYGESAAADAPADGTDMDGATGPLAAPAVPSVQGGTEPDPAHTTEGPELRTAAGRRGGQARSPAGLWERITGNTGRSPERRNSLSRGAGGKGLSREVPSGKVAAQHPEPPGPEDGPSPGIIVAVWGPIGSPGRTTLAINLAAEQAAAGRKVLLIDADSYGASVAASLGLLDESASFAQACRAADQGILNLVHLARTATQVVFGGGTFSLLTGLTRADRWPELRAAAVERVLVMAREMADLVIVDCGFALENDEELSYDTVAPRRNAATLVVLSRAELVYAVGSSDPIGIPRLIRGLAEFDLAFPTANVQVVVNKVRRRAVGGLPERALEQAWERFGPARGISHFLPWDPELTDRALLEGRLLLEVSADAPLRRAIRGLHCAVDQRNAKTAVSKTTAKPDFQG